MVNDKIIKWAILLYGAFYFLPHPIHQRFSLEWILVNNTNLLAEGLPHVWHITIGVVLVIYGFLLLNNTLSLPKFLGKLYGSKEKY